MRRTLLAAALAVVGCNLINTNVDNIEYAFDPQEYMKNFGSTSATVPNVACSAGNDPCGAVTGLPTGIVLFCDTAAQKCAARAELRLSYMVDLSMEMSFPPQVLQLGASVVTVKEVRYWVMSNTLNVATPAIDIYVAPASARDESGGTKLGSLSSLPAKSTTCTDTPDSDDRAGGAMVCDLGLDGNGVGKLAEFAKNYRTPFQVFAHTVVTAKSGDPLPSGAIDFFVRPVITLSVLK